MGNICSGCQRDKYEAKYYTQSKKKNKNIPISEYIEKQRTHYTDQVKSRLNEKSYSEKPIRIEKEGTPQEFWKKNKKSIKAFNPNIRPSTTYQIDTNIAGKFRYSSSIKLEQAYSDYDFIKFNQAATFIQKWFRYFLLQRQIQRHNSSSIGPYLVLQNSQKSQSTYEINTLACSVTKY